MGGRAGGLSSVVVQRDGDERELDAVRVDSTQRKERPAADGADPAGRSKRADERDALADARDEDAEGREQDALQRRGEAHARDARAAGRDRRRRAEHDDGDPGFKDRFLSGRDVDASAGDRAEALGDERQAGQDRQRSRGDRHRAAADRTSAERAAEVTADQAEAAEGRARVALASRSIIGQGQGLLMARLHMTADEAFQLLVRESQARNIKLRDVAAGHVKDAGGSD